MEQLNASPIQYEEGLVAKPRLEPMVSEGKNEVGQNEQKSISTEYKPRVPCPNTRRKDNSDEQFGKFLKLLKKLHINLQFIEALSQMPNAVKFLKELLANKRKLDDRSHVELKVEISSKNIHEPCSIHNKESTHEERRLRIEDLDEWLTFKSRKHDKPKLCQNELNASPNQLKFGDKVSLDVANPHIDTAKPNEEIPFTILSIFPFGIVEVSHPKFGTFKFLKSNILAKSLNTSFPKPHGQAHGSALCCAYTTGNDTAVRYDRVKTEQEFFFLIQGCNKLPRPCDITVGETVKTTRVVSLKFRYYLELDFTSLNIKKP
ncbi:hypothetical protein GOBAR_AA29933 [Gossypium barbadense]|uniref:Uncharacterized protein n=1 Tax=Gossypium barbadense TaxID=3634 RepID=A0A2P5WI41_GOSBA|nr:hypothetical protein GOBAR_AA29933 [Gossypium barbadense]